MHFCQHERDYLTRKHEVDFIISFFPSLLFVKVTQLGVANYFDHLYEFDF